jgi:hypothetical protein
MMEAGIPVIYLYIADVHDRNPLAINPTTGFAAPAHAFGPGEAEYVSQLKAYDQAFGAFFARLAADGITKDNTLFIVVPDENDHFVGSQPTPVGCDGVSVPCNYVFAAEVNEKVNFRLADQAEMKLLHMVTQSPKRTPSLTMFGNENYFFTAPSTIPNCSNPPPANSVGTACVFEPVSPGATFAWNHGDVQKDITRTWVAIAGPGVKREGRDDSVFSDHTDVRPTMLALLGLKDDYVHDGRVLAEKLEERALPHGVRNGLENFVELAQAYKQLTAPLGSVGRNSLDFANRSIVADDTTYAQYLTTLGDITTKRDALAAEIKAALDAAAFAGQRIDERTEDDLVRRANRIIDQVADLAGGHDRDHDHDSDHDHDQDHDH